MVEKHIIEEHNNELKDFEKDYEDVDDPEDTKYEQFQPVRFILSRRPSKIFQCSDGKEG